MPNIGPILVGDAREERQNLGKRIKNLKKAVKQTDTLIQGAIKQFDPVLDEYLGLVYETIRSLYASSLTKINIYSSDRKSFVHGVTESKDELKRFNNFLRRTLDEYISGKGVVGTAETLSKYVDEYVSLIEDSAMSSSLSAIKEGVESQPLDIAKSIEKIKKDIIDNSLKRIFGDDTKQYIMDTVNDTYRELMITTKSFYTKMYGEAIRTAVSSLPQQKLAVLEKSAEAIIENMSKRQKAWMDTRVNDVFKEIARGVDKVAAKEGGVEYFLYEGGLKPDSRAFCAERAGLIFHIDEIKRWPQEEWEGKKAGTNQNTIFDFCGGWNCNHQLVPIPPGYMTEEEIKDHNSKGRQEQKSLLKKVYEGAKSLSRPKSKKNKKRKK